MKGDIGMANYEEQVEQEAAYPIPISLYNCYRTVRHEKRYQEYSYASLLMPHCPVTVVQTYRDGVCSLLFKDGSQTSQVRAVHPHYATQRSNI